MIYEITTNYLNQKFPDANENIDFSEEGEELVKHFQAQGHDGTMNDYKEEVRNAIKDFLSSFGRVSVFFRGKDKIAVKVLPKVDEATIKADLRATVTDGDEEKFIKATVKEICEEALDFSEIINRTWEATYLSHVKSGFFRTVYEKSGSNNREIATEISLDIIRDNFAFLNDSLAEELLEKMLMSKKAETFLEYYGKTMVGDGGIRFKTPDIIDRQGRLWHVSTIRPVVMKFHKENTKALAIRSQVDALVKRVEQIQNDLTKVRNSKDKLENEKVEAILAYSENGTKIATLRKELGSMRKELNSAKDPDERIYIEGKIEKQIDDIETTKLDDNRLRIKKINAEKKAKERVEKEAKLSKKVQGVKIQLQSEESGLENHYKQFHGTKEAYDYIVDAVANALMRKKRVLG